MQVPPEVRDITQLANAVAWGISLFFLRDIYREFRDMRNTVGEHGERIAKIEGRDD